MGIVVNGRSNVSIYNCTIVDFKDRGGFLAAGLILQISLPIPFMLQVINSIITL